MAVLAGNTTIGGNTPWTNGNDGTGTGLDADLLDGQHGTYYVDVVNDTTPQLGGNLDVNGNTITSASNGDISIDPNGSGKIDMKAKTLFEEQVYFSEVNDDSNTTIDWTAGLKHKKALSGSPTLTFTAPTGPTNLVLRIIQGASAYTISWPSSVKWVTSPSIATTSKTYIFNFYYDGTYYYGSMLGPFTTA